MAKRIMIPPRMGGGDVVMRVVLAGEREDCLKTGDGGSWVDETADAVVAAIVTFRGKPPAEHHADLDSPSLAKEAWWRGLSSALRQFLVACYNKINAVTEAEVKSAVDKAKRAGDLYIVPIPDRLGGGTVAVREISAGEYEDRIKASSKSHDPAAWVDETAASVRSALKSFRDAPIPSAELVAWWRGNTAAMRQFLIGAYNLINTASDEEIEGFFAEAEPEEVSAPAA